MAQEDTLSGFKRQTLPLFLSVLFVIVATIGSYRSIYSLDAVDETALPLLFDDEPHIDREELVQTEQFEGKKTPISSYIPNYYSPKTAEDNQTYWVLSGSNRALHCQIHNTTYETSTSNRLQRKKLLESDKEQYVIHIHGLHHTGTGYLRQTMQQALNAEFSTNPDSPAASIHNGSFPYQQHLSPIKKFPSPEDEGQHFQNVFPPFRYRNKWFREAGCNSYDYGVLSYLADECTFDNNSTTHHVGNILLNEWLPFWNASATFLIQKTPLLDVKFHEVVKILPTLHVIIVRHPMTSNAFRSTWMGLMWLDAFSHTFDLLAKNEIEWYAVVTYESLINYHDKVVDELMEVVRSGMRRYGSKLLVDNDEKLRRKLHLHDSKGPLSYLVPKDKSISVWRTCLREPVCQSLLEELTADVLPYFGFVNMNWTDADEATESKGPDEVNEKALGHQTNDASDKGSEKIQLSSTPGLVTVSGEFGHVLFSSESDALNKDDKSVGDPTSKLVAKMKNILAIYKKKYPLKGKKYYQQLEVKQSKEEHSIESPAKRSANDRYWKIGRSDSPSKISCEINIDANSTSSFSRLSNQYVVNIHGLHHTGTGYLRQTIHDSINKIYPDSSSMHDYALHPYIYNSDGKRKQRIPENEGQHLQTVYPPYSARSKLKLGQNFGKYAYLTDYCKSKNAETDYHQIGQVLHNQWSAYWNTSSTFLLQKTPTLDVHFLELTKVMPTFHVLVIRHPMTSNSWSSKWMGLGWLDAWSHTLEVLASREIEWYAVVTYEALVQYHDVVVGELMQVIQSGMERFSGDKSFDDRRTLQMLDGIAQSPKQQNHRQLELHASKSTLTYLKPKPKSIALWKSCNVFQSCRALLQKLTSDILPHLGYIDATVEAGKSNTLTDDPGPKGVSNEFGHVLFSSEGEALKKLKELSDNDNSSTSDGIGDHPSATLIEAMKGLLESDVSPLKGDKTN